MAGGDVTDELYIRTPEDETRRLVCAIARSQEENDDPRKYWIEVGCDADAMIKEGRHWCGVLYLWCLHQANLLVRQGWIIGSGLSNKAYGLKLTTDPKPGDLAYFKTNQHYAMVVEASPGMVGLVNGNSRNKSNPSGPTKVVINEKPRAAVTAFYSIEGILPK